MSKPSMRMPYDELQHIFGDAWFDACGPAARELLLTQGHPMAVRSGEFVVRKGDLPNGLFGVVSGMLAASSVLEDGRQMIFGLLETGDWFGESSSLDRLPRTHDIQALRNCALLHITPPLFERLMQDAGFARAIAVLQTARIRTMFGFFEDAALRSTRVRIARRLVWLARGDAPAMPRHRRVIPVTHQTLAMMLGITRQTLSLELKALAEAGALSLAYGRITIESLQMLKTLSEN